jgi:hypothetical protein
MTCWHILSSKGKDYVGLYRMQWRVQRAATSTPEFWLATHVPPTRILRSDRLSMNILIILTKTLKKEYDMPYCFWPNSTRYTGYRYQDRAALFASRIEGTLWNTDTHILGNHFLRFFLFVNISLEALLPLASMDTCHFVGRTTWHWRRW